MLDIRKSRELQAAILATRAANRDVRLDIYKRARQELGGEWVPALRARASTRMQEAVLVKGARTRVGLDGFRMMAATSRRRLKGGLLPADEWAGNEFGARTRQATFTTHSRNGKAYTVTKMVNRQFQARVKDGRVAFDAASALGTRLVRLWVRVIVDAYRDAFDGKAS
jgi:hypothetical protein